MIIMKHLDISPQKQEPHSRVIFIVMSYSNCHKKCSPARVSPGSAYLCHIQSYSGIFCHISTLPSETGDHNTLIMTPNVCLLMNLKLNILSKSSAFAHFYQSRFFSLLLFCVRQMTDDNYSMFNQLISIFSHCRASLDVQSSSPSYILPCLTPSLSNF